MKLKQRMKRGPDKLLHDKDWLSASLNHATKELEVFNINFGHFREHGGDRCYAVSMDTEEARRVWEFLTRHFWHGER